MNLITTFVQKHYLFCLYLIVQNVMRIVLGVQTSLPFGSILLAIFAGIIFDVFVWLTVFSVFRLIPKKKTFPMPLRLAGIFAGIVAILFVAMAEWNFWMEFRSRFNFIAVDYLIYSKEVLDNLLESFPLHRIMAAIVIISCMLTFLYYKIQTETHHKSILKPFQKVLLLSFLLPVGLYLFAVPFLDQAFSSFPQEQLSRNSYLEFYRAFRSNRISYLQYYKTLPLEKARELIQFRKDQGAKLMQEKPNVVLIIQESLGAKFIKDLGGFDDATPFLNELSSKSMFFTHLYATGTRTVRGLEALSLSVPPTPGYAVVKRPQIPGIASIGSVFTRQNYQKKFIYGGLGYFDNMNAFYENLGFTIVDKSEFSKDEITFSNAWGACDEDLYNKLIKVADEDSKKGQPFLHVVLTTSNHRPFTYPDGKIDIPSGSSRKGAVKYTDFALGQFFKEAPKHDWFDNTLFIVVADHSTEGRGEFDLSLNDFHIPMWIYAPKFIQPQRVDTIGSSIDVLPTILGILGWSYPEPFFGHDLRSNPPERAFIGNYQQVGLYKNDQIVTLAPMSKVKFYRYDQKTKVQVPEEKTSVELENEAIAHYQVASWLLDNQLYLPEADEKMAKR